MWREFEVADILARQRREQAVMTAWFAASYVWRKEMPDLASELEKGRRRGPVRQTVGQMRQALRSLGLHQQGWQHRKEN